MQVSAPDLMSHGVRCEACPVELGDRDHAVLVRRDALDEFSVHQHR
jgi:hypothetical protein